MDDKVNNKGNVDVFPRILSLKCGKIEVIAERKEGTGVRILIDGEPARGIYDLQFHFNLRRPLQLSMGVDLDKFQFELAPRDKPDQGR